MLQPSRDSQATAVQDPDSVGRYVGLRWKAAQLLERDGTITHLELLKAPPSEASGLKLQVDEAAVSRAASLLAREYWWRHSSLSKRRHTTDAPASETDAPASETDDPASETADLGVACAAVEGLSRTLAAELGPQGVRVVCIRPHRIGETLVDADFPVPRDEFIGFLEGMTLTKKLPTLADVANTAVFLASDHAAAMSGAVANLTCGMSVD